MGQQRNQQNKPSNIPLPIKTSAMTVSDLSSLTMSERRIIRNYRAMEKVAQQTFEEISEEFARTLPAPDRQELATVLAIS